MVEFEALRNEIFNRLERELPPKLYYHGIHHTRDDVLPAVERLADIAGIGGTDLLLLQTAALYHDIGYTRSFIDHEVIGAGIAAQELPSLGFSNAQTEQVASMIVATKLPQSPRNYLEEIMCDADLDNLGRVDFFMVSHSLRLELIRSQGLIPLRDWYKRQLKFLSAHQYFTDAARSLRDEGKAQNIRELESLALGD